MYSKANRDRTLKELPAQTPSALDMTRTLEETRDALKSFETSALAGIASTLAEAAESLARTARGLHEMSREEWMTPEQAADYLGKTKRGFERIAPHLPRRYVSKQDILYPRSLIDEALYGAISPEEAIVGNGGNCRHADKSSRGVGGDGGTGAAESIQRALRSG